MSSITINSNIAALNAQRQFGKSTDGLRDAFSRLSSGLRINRASDDAAGLSIASSLNADRRVFDQGVRNLNDGLSLLAIADGALEQLGNITVRLSELAEQAANGAMKNSQRQALDREAQALKAEFKRIAQTTQFNGLDLFSGALGTVRLQTGFGADAAVQSTLGGVTGTGQFENVRNVNTGVTSGYSVSAADFNSDGLMDLIMFGRNGSAGTYSVMLGDGNGSFSAGVSFVSTADNGGGHGDMTIGDFNNDGIVDLLMAGRDSGYVAYHQGRGDGTFADAVISLTPSGTYMYGVAAGDVNNDGILDLAIAQGQNVVTDVLFGVGNGTFSGGVSYDYSSTGSGNVYSVHFADFNGDGNLDLFSNLSGGATSQAAIQLGDGRGGFSTASFFATTASESYDSAVGDFNNDAKLDLIVVGFGSGGEAKVLLGNGLGGFGAAIGTVLGGSAEAVDVGDMNGDGNLDFVAVTDGVAHVRLGNGNGTFNAGSTYAADTFTMEVALADFNRDGVLDLVALSDAVTRVNTYLARTTSGLTPLLDFSLATQADARQAIPMFKQKLEQLGKQRGTIGAFQARVTTAINNTASMSLNVASAASQITNADVAEESAKLVKQKILQQVGAAVLAQANQGPELALSLLRFR